MSEITQQPFPLSVAQALEHFEHPAVASCFLTTTESGGWKVVAQVDPAAKLPLGDLERAAGGLDISYQQQPLPMAVARPAYPAMGE